MWTQVCRPLHPLPLHAALETLITVVDSWKCPQYFYTGSTPSTRNAEVLPVLVTLEVLPVLVTLEVLPILVTLEALPILVTLVVLPVLVALELLPILCI